MIREFDMKVYISADIEGAAGITNWDEAAQDRTRPIRNSASR